MAEKNRNNRRQRVGYGSSYRRGRRQGSDAKDEIALVLGKQPWMVTPERDSEITRPCLWMQAGVVDFKRCHHFYDCSTCKYDQGMSKRVAEGRQQSWQNAMRRKPDLQRVCRHSLTGRIDSRRCAYDYHCARCDFDQYFEDVWSLKADSIPPERQTVKGFDVALNCYFHRGHTWARVESGGYIRIGLDDFALKLFGQPDAFELPLTGKALAPDEIGWGFTCKKKPAAVRSPVGGIIAEVNAAVRETPQIARQEPYGAGWLFMVRPPDMKAALQPLMNDSQGLVWMHTEIDALENLIEQAAGPLPADGGLLAADIYDHLPALGWEKLTRRFLGT